MWSAHFPICPPIGSQPPVDVFHAPVGGTDLVAALALYGLSGAGLAAKGKLYGRVSRRGV
jgi:hypothetical protein